MSLFTKSAKADEQPKVLIGEGLDFSLASGDYEIKTGPIKNFTPVISIVGKIAKSKEANFKAIPGYWALLYIINDSVNVNKQVISQYNLIVFEKDNEEISVMATEDSQVLFLSAEPIDEPVSAKDNFVMNTPEEIEQALSDYRNGVFGVLSY
jgi:redox-sensitive bicupin YhaK (pirin superfamily)